MACVLIVDDEKNIRSGLALAFEDEGYDTLEAENGEVAWNIINKKSVDLVITDLRMPVMQVRSIYLYDKSPGILLQIQDHTS